MNTDSDFFKRSEEFHEEMARVRAVLKRCMAKLRRDHRPLRRQLAEMLEGERVDIMLELEAEAKAERRRGVA